MTDNELQHWMTCFILEVRKQDGNVYASNTLHHIIAGVMWYLRWNRCPDVDFLQDAKFSNFRHSLDAEMKHL